MSLFPQGSAKAIQRLLKRAQDKEAKAAQRNVVKALRGGIKGGRLGSRIGSRLAGELAKAVRQRGAPRKEAPSIRQKASAAQGGGKPFHFAHSVVTKADPTAPATSRASKGGRAAAHMRYIERETAVEGPARDGPEVAALAEDLAKSLDRDGVARDDGSWDRGLGDGGGAGPTMGSAAAAQGYVENPAKLANGERIIFSFGNIGAEFEERVRFWTALEEAEAHPGARVQHRLIVELPHEATPEARHEIVRTFAKKFEDDGVPFWAALHAPGEANDSRNFHAHIVYSERPAKRVFDEADGREKWDFEVVRRYVDSSRHTKTSRPLRQAKLRDYHDRAFIPDMRKRYSEIANAVLTRDDVKDATGSPVRYDHRSYKDMGVDATPMKSVNRIVADRLKDGLATVLDGDYTRKMVAAEIQAAARARDKHVLELIALDRALMDVVKDPAKAAKVNPRLPKTLRVSPLAQLSKAVAASASRRLMEARHAAVRLDVMEKATAASLTRIIEATEPKTVAAAAKAKDPLVRAAAPDPATAALLHEAAKEELAETRAQAAKERKSLGYRAAAAVGAWQAAVAPFRADTEPSMKAAIRAATEQRPARTEDRSARRPPTREADATTDERSPRATATKGAEAAPSPAAAREEPRTKPTEPAATVTAPTASRTAGIDPEALKATAKMYADALMKRTLERAKGGAVAPQMATAAQRRPGRVPTVLEAQAASLGVSAFIRRIRETTDSVEERLAMLQHWTSRPIFKATPAGPAPKTAPQTVTPTTSQSVDQRPTNYTASEKAAPEQGASAPAEPPPTRASEPSTTESSRTPAAPTITSDETSTPAKTVKAAPQPEQADLWPAEAPVVKDVEGGERRRRMPTQSEEKVHDQPAEMGALGVAGLVSREPRPEPNPVRKSTQPVVANAAHPVEAKQKRKRTPEEEEEEDRRRKQRKAVLSKRRKKREIYR